MLKRYLQFLKESQETIGEEIERLAKGDDYALNIISHYTQDFDPTIRLANVINLLDKKTQDFILKSIKDHKERNEVEGDPDVTAYINANTLLESNQIGGKNLLKCFLKVVTALGQKDIQIDWKNPPQTFLMIFKTINLNVQDVKSVMSRYNYFDQFLNQLDYTQNECQIFYGITDDMNSE